MDAQQLPVIFFALGANLSFALGSQVFTHYSRAVNPAWMNAVKAIVALVCFILINLFFVPQVSTSVVTILVLGISGFIGLGFGDIFLLRSFAELGPGRTLMLFSFQPLILGFFSYFLFDQGVDTRKFWAILFFVLCVFLFSFESFQKSRKWQMAPIMLAFSGILLDACGVLMSRWSFNSTPELGSLQGNLYRTFGAVLFYLILGMKGRFQLRNLWKARSTKDKGYLIIGSFLGTFLSLSLYLNAIRLGHLATISGLSITGVLFSSLFECLIEKKWPSRYFMTAFCAFLIGMKFLLF
ncbi:MAG: EamA family transporter [Bdellovibrio sp. CG12_big_fil_rev_8_21_14_0_65_39_13]|nr:MAG: EamA family transporter [Bdellovibrio sp. CG22_combo_CG10-13_8_21_14_all_39_27]PIQ57568.1 MAG: EamA family transporter [Bdellovibrio sp. CG12_big_fil_rev_8_21_14_0_65_39_13]PIR33771.1 MAG: EamA family transporter [Bdellovibrio sp. CG11_big_fil_rev_8_21_14_0_20_39_38]